LSCGSSDTLLLATGREVPCAARTTDPAPIPAVARIRAHTQHRQLPQQRKKRRQLHRAQHLNLGIRAQAGKGFTIGVTLTDSALKLGKATPKIPRQRCEEGAQCTIDEVRNAGRTRPASQRSGSRAPSSHRQRPFHQPVETLALRLPRHGRLFGRRMMQHRRQQLPVRHGQKSNGTCQLQYRASGSLLHGNGLAHCQTSTMRRTNADCWINTGSESPTLDADVPDVTGAPDTGANGDPGVIGNATS
jgi:hypothetical protein